jgi:hypothetical protein
VTVLLIPLFVVLPMALLPWLIRSSRTSRAGANLSRAGLMELQHQLEPERKVEVLREMESKQDLMVELSEKFDQGH